MRRTPTDVTQIFFGCPHKCSNVQELEDSIARLLLANENAHPCGVANTIMELGRSIIQINEAFLAFIIPFITHILSIYSTDPESSSRVSCSLVIGEILSKYYYRFTPSG